MTERLFDCGRDCVVDYYYNTLGTTMTNGVVQGSEVIRAEKYGSDRTDTDAYHHHNYAGQPRLSKENLTHATFREVIPLTSSKKIAVFILSHYYSCYDRHCWQQSELIPN